uniref:ATP-binding cassette domain-containing protein n=1 Tax=Candidatus Symbiothrix dinenymphae TaxID=467085 RepID=UPI000A5E829A
MIEAKHIIKSFEDKQVIKDVSATFDKGKTNLVIGRSGSGKTVFMKILIGLLSPDSGEILYDRRNLPAMKKPELNALRQEMGMLFQGSALFDSMTVMENVMFPLTMFSSDNRQQQEKRAIFCLERVQMRD